jgi:FKBP-type peptidyl-prolyl cis-trans isomerase FkpA
MKRKILRFVMPILAATLLSSCLYKGIDWEPQTLQEEMMALTSYIKNLEKEGFDVDTTELGVYYFIITPGDGPYPNMGDSLSIKHDGYLIDGSLFYSSKWNNADGILNFVLGDGEAIPGLNDGMKVIRKGSKVQLMIPSTLGFGDKWNGTVPPNSTLVYIVEMINIK